MTTDHDFKQLVRARMGRTGERYMTARAQLLRTRPPADTPAVGGPVAARVGGRAPDLAAVANALARAGAVGVLGGAPDEDEVAGLGGGIGFLYGVFEWQGHGPTVTLTTRTDSTPDPFVAAVLDVAGVHHDVHVTTGAATARRHLDAALDAGRPVLATVDTALLPHHGADRATGMSPRVVGVLGREGDDLLVDDVAVDALPTGADRFAAARASLRAAKHRLVVLGDPTTGHDPLAAARAGLRRTVEGYDRPPARPFAGNVGTAGLRRWADRLVGADARGWARVLAAPRDLHLGMVRTWECIELDGTTTAAGRPAFARWLRTADGALDEPRLAEVAALVDRAAAGWAEVAATARAAHPTVAAACDELVACRRLVDEDGTAAGEEVRRRRSLLPGLREDCDLGGADAGATFERLAAGVREVADVERAAVDLLATAAAP